MKIEAIIFDIGGVIYRAGDRPLLREKWASKCGLSFDEFDDIVFRSDFGMKALRGEITSEEKWAEINKVLKLADNQLALLRKESWGGIWDAQVLNLAKKLKPNYKLGILSDASSDAREKVKPWVNEALFDVIVFSAEQHTTKPDPAIYQTTLDQLGVKAESAIFIDDRPRNIEGAQKLGIHAILYKEFPEFKATLTHLLTTD